MPSKLKLAAAKPVTQPRTVNNYFQKSRRSRCGQVRDNCMQVRDPRIGSHGLDHILQNPVLQCTCI